MLGKRIATKRLARQPDVLSLVNAHCEGEVGRVAVAGVPALGGSSPLEVMQYLFNTAGDSWRRMCAHELRGCITQSTNLLLPSTVADVGVVVL